MNQKLDMQNIFELVDELPNEDIDWFFSTGIEKQVINNAWIIHEGESLESIFIVLQGLLGVKISAVGDESINTIGPGDIVGDISFLENSSASASVYAMENSLLLELPKQKLALKLHEDEQFASRLYRSLAIINSRRLIKNVGLLRTRLNKKSQFDTELNYKWNIL